MGFTDFYFERQKNFKVKIQEKPQSDLKYIVVIPCYNEFNLINTLNSIWESKRINCSIEVLIVINSSENSEQKIKEQNKKTYNEAKSWIINHTDSLLRFFLIHEENLPKKFAGAGLARKIGMDQAVFRFNQLNKEDGFILSMDADAMIELNYFVEIDRHIKIKPKTKAFTIYFEHPLCGDDFATEVYEAIITYELYLRYYKLALEFTGFPYSFYTIGSCFGVRAETYAKQGGMNRKQAGEDFYFLHKVFPLGNCDEINSTCVYPSSRPSDRVPFGTGPMVMSIMESKGQEFLTYNLEAILCLKNFFRIVEKFFKIDEKQLTKLIESLDTSLKDYLLKNDFQSALKEINQNSSSLKTFTKRFYNWFDAFRVLKYLNDAHQGYFKKKSFYNEAVKLFEIITDENRNNMDLRELLIEYRKLEKQI